MEKKGFQIGSYRITKTLGQGTFGKVKEGVHIRTGQKVAIKILDKSKITDVNDVERVSREIHILKVVRHPHIIQLYETIETPNRLFLIMEHCCNGELFSFITSKNRLKEEEACKLFQQLISALSYLGKLGIVHRDVKPENLLLDQQLNLKMIDFGLSNMYRSGEKLATACGSPCYAAPELIKGLEYLGPKADLWSAGVVLFTMVNGHLPFEDSNTQSLYQKILNARYKFTCFLSQEIQNLIKNILVPDPELRYGLKQVMSNSWFKKTYQPPEQLPMGIEVGIDQIKIFDNVIKDMESTEELAFDKKHVRLCLTAHVHNPVTAYYYLLLKKKIIQGEPLDDLEAEAPGQALLMPQERQTKRYQSIEPVRTTLYNEKNKYQLRKIAEGLNDFNIARVSINNHPSEAGTKASNGQSQLSTQGNPSGGQAPHLSIMSPQAMRNQIQQHNNLQNQLLLMSPDQMIFSPTQLDSQGLISPTLVAYDNREKLQLQVQKAYQEQKKQMMQQQQQQSNSLQSSTMSQKKNTSGISSTVKNSQGVNKRNLQAISAFVAKKGDPSALQGNSQPQKQIVTRNAKQRMLNKTIEPVMISQGSSNLGQFDLLTPQMQQPVKATINKGSSTFEMQNNDYNTQTAHQSLFSNREERKTTRFKKNPSGDRGYGKQKYSSQKASSVSSGSSKPMMNSNGGHGGNGVLPHSLLEKEIRQIMNQSQMVQSTRENDISFNQGSNLRRIANQRLSAMSNYEPVLGTQDSDARGSQQFVNVNPIGQQIMRHGKGKARQVNSFKDGFKSAEKRGVVEKTNASLSVQRNQTQMVAKSIPDDKMNLPKPQNNVNHARKASVGIISPSQHSSALFDNKLIFSGSQLTTYKINQKGPGQGVERVVNVKDKLNITQPIKQQHLLGSGGHNSTVNKVTKQQSSNKKQVDLMGRVQMRGASPCPDQQMQKMHGGRLQPATGESLEIQQVATEPQPMSMTEQLSGLVHQINSNKQMQMRQGAQSGISSINPSQITSPNNNLTAQNQQFNNAHFNMLKSPHQPVKQTPQSLKQPLSDFQNMQLNPAMMLGTSQMNSSHFNQQHAQKRNTGAKTSFNTTQPIIAATMPPKKGGSGKQGQSTTERQVGSSQPSKGPSGAGQSTRHTRHESQKQQTASYYDSLMRFQQQEMMTAQHHRAVTSIGMNSKLPGGGLGPGGHWQKVNSVRVVNNSQPAKSHGGTTKKGSNSNGHSRNQKNNNTSAGQPYPIGLGKVMQGGVTNFNVYQHIYPVVDFKVTTVNESKQFQQM